MEEGRDKITYKTDSGVDQNDGKKNEEKLDKIKKYEEKLKKCSYLAHPRVRPWPRPWLRPFDEAKPIKCFMVGFHGEKLYFFIKQKPGSNKTVKKNQWFLHKMMKMCKLFFLIASYFI